MELKLNDLTQLLEVPEKQIKKWIKEKELPHYKIHNELKFNKAEIFNWILKNNIKVSSRIMDMNLTNMPVVFTDLIDKGGIYYDIKGNTVSEIIGNAVQAINTPDEISKDRIVISLLEREEMMPTAVGNGIAIPHARNPIIADIKNESISVCFLENDIDYDALDGIKVNVLFVVLSANPKRHLEILSKIGFLCQQSGFMKLLKDRSQKDVIMKFIDDFERQILSNKK
jgi:nitrogen PTS system EIIA component